MAWRLDSLTPVIPLPPLSATDRWSHGVEASRTYSSDDDTTDGNSTLEDQLIYQDCPEDSLIYLNDEMGSSNPRRVRHNGSVMVAVARTPVHSSENAKYEMQQKVALELQHAHIARCRFTYTTRDVHYNLYYPAADMSLQQYLAIKRHGYSEWNWQSTILKAMGCLSHALACLHEKDMTGICIEDILVVNDQMCFANREYSSALNSSFPDSSEELSQAPSATNEMPEIELTEERSKAADIYTLGSTFSVMLLSIPKVGKERIMESRPQYFLSPSKPGVDAKDLGRVVETPELLHLFSLMMGDDPKLRPTATSVAEFLKSKSYGLGYTWLRDDPFEITSPLCGDCCF